MRSNTQFTINLTAYSNYQQSYRLLSPADYTISHNLTSMSQPSTTSHFEDAEKGYTTNTRSCFSPKRKSFWIILCSLLVIIAIALGVGLGVGLNNNSSSTESPTPEETPSQPSNTTLSTNGTFWQPSAGETWQIVLLNALNNTSLNVSVYDIDLFTNSASTITSLHDLNRKVICYFSAGSYEDFRPDASQFQTSDYAKGLDGWPGEYWLNTSSPNVRNIMSARIAMAASKGCDGVDPDNIDGYDNDTGLDLSTADAVDYLTFLANEAHGRGLSIGLKNGGAIVNQTVGMLQWEVNEQCVQYEECELFRPFVDEGKPVFHIEYPKGGPPVSADVKTRYCEDAEAKGFSTVLKNLDLDEELEEC
jgi:endo-alpha-1,4-polygalactosaminidase (GH114 family)